MRFTLSLSIPLALGNGTRPAGKPLAVFTVQDGAEPSELISTAWDGTLPGGATLAEGVSAREVITALRSPHCVLTGENEAAVACPPNDDPAPSVEWRTVPISKLYFGPDEKRIRGLLRKAGLKTAGDIDREGNAHQGLTWIDGITEADQQTVAAVMRGLITKPAGEPAEQ